MTDLTHRHPNVCNLRELDLAEESHGDRYSAAHAMIGRLIGSRQLGCRFTEIAPGNTAWPYHRHHGNEELFVILEGSGTLRIGDAEVEVGREDVVEYPDSGHFAVFAGAPPGGKRGKRTFHHIGRLANGVSYRSIVDEEDGE